MALKDVKILIVDDEFFSRRTLRDMLEKIGFSVVAEAIDGSEAVEKYRTYRPHITILDIFMPKKNGIDATREIIAINKSANVLVCTASDYRYDTQAALAVGAKDIILKPFVPREIYETVKEALGGK